MSGGMENMDRNKEIEISKIKQAKKEIVATIIDDYKWLLAEEIVERLDNVQ
jgi:hypothetical protein